MRKTAVHFSYNLALLFTLPVAFIVVYVWLYFNPSIVIYQHLSAIALLVFSILSIKLLIHHYFNHQKLVLFVGTVLYSSFIFTLLVYYALVFISLSTWSKVITKEFITSYLAQIDFLLEALDISYYLVIVLAVVIYSCIALGCYFFLKKFHWLPERHPKSTWLIGPLIACVCLLFSVYSYVYLTTGDGSSQEPLKLTFLSGKTKSNLKHDAKLDYSSNQQLNRLEDQARQNYHATTSAKKRNLIVLVVDGLRPDHLGVYGYQKDTSPFLDQLSRHTSAHKFTNVRSVCGETTCAHAGFMASRFVQDLPDNLFTLQEVLKHNGYRTQFIISGDHINFYNIRDVYGEVDDYYDGSMAKGYYFNDDAITINKTKTLPDWDGTPTMIHYHLLSAHMMGKKYPEYQKFKPYKSYTGTSKGQAKVEYDNFYDNGVLQVDAVIKDLLALLKEKKYLDNALVVITADHGEALGEHCVFTHTNNVIEEILSIPLLMMSYGYESKLPANYDGFMSLIDLAPTILDELGLNIPTTWAGSSIYSAKTRPFTYFEMSAHKGVYDHRHKNTLWKYWRNFNTGEEFVFNITQDPQENNNLIWRTPKKLLHEWRTAIQISKTS